MDAVEKYISEFPPQIQNVLNEYRNHIRQLVPDAQETITYGIPTFKLNGRNLVHFGGFKSHTSFFPGASGIEAFKNEFSEYKVSKGTVQFPLDKPLPLDLITRIVKFRIEEEMGRMKKK
ncbi:MAG TPA: DUF1801 domain-containing protein [Bacteroidales bacterium]|nr:DUF1801 domain-containing protein [Bacteroidales bacterium]